MTQSTTCANIGYEKRNIEDFCNMLLDNGIETVIDVRASPSSRRPEYRMRALAGALGESGIRYIHCEAAGNPFRPTSGSKRDREACVELYEKHLLANPHIVDEIQGIITGSHCALLCYEARRSDCHRGIIIRALKERMPRLAIVDL